MSSQDVYKRQALYIRPFIIAVDPHVGVHPAHHLLFIIIQMCIRDRGTAMHSGFSAPVVF